jgi:transcription elongation factor Elf1
MPRQTKQLIEFGDVKAVVLNCKHCNSSVSFSIEGFNRIPVTCPACGQDWDTTMSANGYNAHIEEYMNSHKKLQKALIAPVAEGIGYTASLEVELGGAPAAKS